jgi:hypothetical protein
MKRLFSFTLRMKNLSRSLTDEGWRELDPEYIAAWNAMQETHGEKNYSAAPGPLTIRADFSAPIQRLAHHYDVMSRIYKDPAKPDPTPMSEFKHDPVDVPIHVSLDADSSTKIQSWVCRQYLLGYLHDLFMCMNIAAPGSFDLYLASIHDVCSGDTEEITLSNYIFDNALTHDLESGDPKLKIMPFAGVAGWLVSVRPDLKQIPRNPAEKTVFALLHMAQGDVSVNTVVWMFYALEAILSTRPGENFRMIVTRLSQLLSLSEKEKKHISRELRKAYDLRSSFVHGGMNVTHPLHNDTLDPAVYDNYSDLTRAVAIGTILLLRIFQMTAQQGWKYPAFTETVTGEPIVTATNSSTSSGGGPA